MFDIEQAQQEVHAVAVRKGWFQGVDKTPDVLHGAMTIEIGEATEHVAVGDPPLYKMDNGVMLTPQDAAYTTSKAKPQGEAVKLANVLIRILNYCEHRNLPLAEAYADKMDFYESLPDKV